MAVSQRDWDFWDENGYVVIHDAVPKRNCNAVVEAIWRFTGKDPHDPETWPGYPISSQNGFVQIYHDQAIWDNRQFPRLYEAFAEILGTPALWVSYDCASMNPPNGPKWSKQRTIHFDLNPVVKPLPLRVQGVLCLTDTDANMGGFHCVPGFHKEFDRWTTTHPVDEIAGVDLDPSDWNSTPVPAKAGDLIIWQSTLPHGNGINRSNRIRMAQYITMGPVEDVRKGIAFEMISLDGNSETRMAAVQRHPYQCAVARALGVPEGYVEDWITRAKLGRSQIQSSIPAPRFKPLLSVSQLAGLPDLLAGPEHGNASDAFGIARLMEVEYDASYEIRPIVLTKLGKTLVGAANWNRI